MNNHLSQAIVALIGSEYFYAELIMGMDISMTKSIPTAGVFVKDRVHMHINPEFFASLSPESRVAVLKHECLHILHEHIVRSKELAPEVYGKTPEDVAEQVINQLKHRAINIAADCAINPTIPSIPADSMFPSMFDLVNGETLEWYHENLKNNEKAKNVLEYDGHALWGESDGDKELLREKIRQHVNSAADKTRSAGRMTNGDELLVNKLNAAVKNWRAELSRFVARQVDIVLESSRKKRNRRYGVAYPGTVKWERLTVGVAIDTSGSVSDEALMQFMAEIDKISRYATVIVVEADSEIKNRYIYDPKKTYTIRGRGGTAYQPAFTHFSTKEKIDGLIYFGDMDCYDNEEIKKPTYPVLWAIVGTQRPPVPWGHSIHIEEGTKK